MQTFPARLFHWTPEERTFVAEVSDLSRHVNGSIGKTFLIRNDKTGGTCQFELDYIDRDEKENETLSWTYLSTDGTKEKQGLKVVIFND